MTLRPLPRRRLRARRGETRVEFVLRRACGDKQAYARSMPAALACLRLNREHGLGGNDRFRYYACDFCDGFHLTRQSVEEQLRKRAERREREAVSGPCAYSTSPAEPTPPAAQEPEDNRGAAGPGEPAPTGEDCVSLPVVSPTEIAEHATCPRRHHQARVARADREPSDRSAADLGTLVHRLLATATRQGQLHGTYPAAADVIAAAARGGLDPDTAAEAGRMTCEGVRMLPPDPARIVGQEIEAELELGDVVVQMRLDLVLLDRNGVDAVVVDWKTTLAGAPGTDELARDPQVQAALAWARWVDQHGPAPTARRIYLVDGTVRRVRYRAGIEAQLQAAARAAVRGRARKKPPRGRTGRHCATCPFRADCPDLATWLARPLPSVPVSEVPGQHVPWRCTPGDYDCTRAWCATHHGELFLCAVCNQAEAELEAVCPGAQLSRLGAAYREASDRAKAAEQVRKDLAERLQAALGARQRAEESGVRIVRVKQERRSWGAGVVPALASALGRDELEVWREVGQTKDAPLRALLALVPLNQTGDVEEWCEARHSSYVKVTGVAT